MTYFLDQQYFGADAPLAEVNAGLDRLIGDLALDFWSVGVLRPPRDDRGNPVPGVEPGGIASYPEAWIERYLARSYLLLDPVCDLALRSNRPFFWGQDRQFLFAFRARQRRVFEEATAFGISSGLSIPVRGADGSVVVANFVAANPTDLRDAVLEQPSLLLAAAFDAHDAVLGAMSGGSPLAGGRADPEGPALAVLTVREKECLSWTLEGLKAGDVAERLCLSIHTVNRHASSATRKLGCASKHQAAVRALRAGLI